uniref:Peptidase S1 domain-containing protein n=3 Tax=Ciona intestinalis TaxID=7719 RepID=F7BCE0_CIOIN
MVYTTCMPRCTATCANADNLPTTCQTQPDQCIAGCKCPDNLPILNDGLCIPRALCPTPTVEPIQCGKQYLLHQVRIVGGETANEGSWPWATQVHKGIPRTFQCGGTLICSGWVLTAAHCFLSEQGYSLDLQHMNVYLVKIGKFRRSNEPDRQTVSQVPERIVVHDSYDVTRNIHDIALIKLRTPVEMSNTIRPACLPRPSTYLPSMGTSIWGPPFGSHCYVVGWGSTRNRGPTNEYLKQARLQVKLNNVCQRLYMYYRPNINMCVGGDGDDTCRGDSGGPLMCKHGDRWYVDGITSYGRRCGVVGEPGVYTRVTSFSSWIRTITGNTCGHPDTVWTPGTN